MSKKFQLQIPEPCHEDWNKMTPGDKGRFCDSCQKTVHDFTGMSDAQLIAFFKKPSIGSVCGRFYNDQLERDFEMPRKRIPWIKYFFQFAIPVFLTGLKTQAQGNILYKEKISGDTLISCTSSVKDVIAGGIGAFKTISGRVVDEKGNGISFASIYLKGTKQGVMCDSTGFFKLDISAYEKKVTLIASCVGYLEKERQINLRKDNSTEITLVTNATLNGEVVVTSYVSVKGRLRMGAYCVRSTSFIQQVKYFFSKDSIKVYPNPAKTESEIKIGWRKIETGEYNIDLYNLQGQLIQSSLAKGDSETTVFAFHIPRITPGSYILCLTNKKSGKKHTDKIIIQ
ncbi:MAG TPA: carboxypeptidase-like regulatory domain-containing protein [Chitinophagaceae bacterium]|nr:carboxypeptidase-like regulatory domain-containing protein [Chitinophagaceae bacterium]